MEIPTYQHSIICELFLTIDLQAIYKQLLFIQLSPILCFVSMFFLNFFSYFILNM